MATAVRITPTRSQADEWGLVLTAAGIPHGVEPEGAGWAVTVPATDALRAREALDAYDAEAREVPHAAPSPGTSARSAWTVGVTAGVLLVACFLVTGPPRPGSRGFERGAAASGRMLAGEPWRAVTALTLHTDAAHVAGNAVATAVLLPPIVHRLGPGLAVWLVLLAGMVANVLAAMTHQPGHIAVGASTATFAAIGILAALRVIPSEGAGDTRRQSWIVLVATLLLLTMLGAAQNADVVAHGIGLLSGGALGLVGALLRPSPGARVQWALAATAVMAIAGCWHLALAGATP